MFFGQHYHNVDKKGRVFVPAKFREELGEEFMLCCSSDGQRCLCVYSMEEWEKIDQRLKALPSSQAGLLIRFMYSGAEKVSCDAQGRVLIPQNLRDHARLEGEATIIGMSSKIEIWNAASYKSFEEEISLEQIAALAQQLNF
jgi:MraZ protein